MRHFTENSDYNEEILKKSNEENERQRDAYYSDILKKESEDRDDSKD